MNMLLSTHRNRVDIIYTDPPYNTGKDDFIYDDGWSKTEWASMMNKRLSLCRELLRDDGVIFVSIDDNSVEDLKLIMNKIFGAENFLTTIVFDKTSQGQTLGNGFKKTHEFVLSFQKSNKFVVNQEPIDDESKYKFVDKNGRYAITNKLNSINSYLDTNRNRGYTIYYNEKLNDCQTRYEYDKDTLVYSDKYDDELIKQGYIPIRPDIRKNKQTCWNWSEERFLKDWKEEVVFKIDGSKKLFPYHKNRFTGAKSPVTIKTFDTRQDGAGLLNAIFGTIDFQYSKPITLIKWLLQRTTNKDAIVLDPFMGSGTTGHAVLELNKEDGGHRKFIGCQLEDSFDKQTNDWNNISHITCERISKVINGYTDSKGNQIDGLGSSFKVLEVANYDVVNTKYKGYFDKLIGGWETIINWNNWNLLNQQVNHQDIDPDYIYPINWRTKKASI